jgi:hypothetical protein
MRGHVFNDVVHLSVEGISPEHESVLLADLFEGFKRKLDCIWVLRVLENI